MSFDFFFSYEICKLLYSILDKLFSAFSIFSFSLSIEIGSSLSDEFLLISSGSGLLETKGSRVLFYGFAKLCTTDAGFGYSFGGSGSLYKG